MNDREFVEVVMLYSCECGAHVEFSYVLRGNGREDYTSTVLMDASIIDDEDGILINTKNYPINAIEIIKDQLEVLEKMTECSYELINITTRIVIE